ncbi:GAF and ANTAR domain-containing protein [Promicromonospora sp. Marseille-Q5078]
MTPRTPADSLADAASALVREHDISDLLVQLVRDAAQLTGSSTAGLLVRPSGGSRLEVLAATDHVTSHLELYQAMQDEGPCVEVCATGRAVTASEPTILARWPVVGPAILSAGLRHVHTYPLTWRGNVLGGLNIFGRDTGLPDEEAVRMAYAFADMVTLVVAQPERDPEGEIDRRLARALRGRVVIEQAKGVLAQRLGVDQATAYELLLAERDQKGTTLTAAAERVVAEAYGP